MTRCTPRSSCDDAPDGREASSMSSKVITTFQVGFGVPGGTVMAVLLGVLLLVVMLLGLRARVVGTGRKLLLGALRVVSATLAFALASQPTFWAERARVDPGSLAVVVDVSRSMGVRTKDTRLAAARRLLERWVKSER